MEIRIGKELWFCKYVFIKYIYILIMIQLEFFNWLKVIYMFIFKNSFEMA